MSLESVLTKEISKIVTTNQDGIHDDLELIYSKQNLNYQRPIADFSKETFLEIVDKIGQKQVIFDFGCGVGQSTYKIAQDNPECIVIGIDKSISRLDRNNHFKKDPQLNAYLFRGELLDLIYLVYKAYEDKKIRIKSLYFLYPNPWPKKIHVKRRFHGNPIAPFIYNIKVPIILRSNWKLYLEEFSFCSKLYERIPNNITRVNVEVPLTPFEKKYHDSGQEIYELIVL